MNLEGGSPRESRVPPGENRPWASRRRTASRLAWLALLAIVALGAVAAVAGTAAARPGGGSTYSGGGGHSSGGGTSSGGGFSSSGGGGGGSGDDAAVVFELIYWVCYLIYSYPVIGLPLVGGVVAWLAYNAYQKNRNKDWDSGPPLVLEQVEPPPDLGQLDPAYSQVVFEDFAYRLFSTAHRARHTAESLASVAPYVSEAARKALAAREPIGEPVLQVIVGAMRAYRFDVPPAAVDAEGRTCRVRIGLEYEANIATASHTYYTVENWMFGRSAAAHSKPPGVARTFPCPNCGAPWQASQTGTQVCASCGQAVDNGRFDWVVEQIALISSDERPPTLTTEVPERGTDLATYRQDNVHAAWAQLMADDPQLTDASLRARLAMIYDQLNAAWSNNELAPVRGLVTDGLFDYLEYWVDAHKRQGMRNVLADMRIERTELAKLTHDRYFDAITIRLWASGKDYVIREPSGDRVRGSATRERAYSEYWTLIRSAGRKGPALATTACGNCGAPLKVAQAGECEHCGAHVTGGEFDWVLSKIEQDDSYRG